jgi:hypothetical protein
VLGARRSFGISVPLRRGFFDSVIVFDGIVFDGAIRVFVDTDDIVDRVIAHWVIVDLIIVTVSAR